MTKSTRYDFSVLKHRIGSIPKATCEYERIKQNICLTQWGDGLHYGCRGEGGKVKGRKSHLCKDRNLHNPGNPFFNKTLRNAN